MVRAKRRNGDGASKQLVKDSNGGSNGLNGSQHSSSSKSDPYAELDKIPSAFSTLTAAAKKTEEEQRVKKVDAVPVGERRSDKRVARRMCDGNRAERVSFHSNFSDDGDKENGAKVTPKNKKKKKTKKASIDSKALDVSRNLENPATPGHDSSMNGSFNIFSAMRQKREKAANAMQPTLANSLVPRLNSVFENGAGRKRRFDDDEEDNLPYMVEDPSSDGEEMAERIANRPKRSRVSQHFNDKDFEEVEKVTYYYDEDEDEDFDSEAEDDEEDVHDEEEEVLTDEMSAEEKSTDEEEEESDEEEEEELDEVIHDQCIDDGVEEVESDEDEDEEENEDEEESDEDEEEEEMVLNRKDRIVTLNEEESEDEDEEEGEDEDEEEEEDESSLSDDSDSSHVSDDSYENASLSGLRKTSEVVRSRQSRPSEESVDFTANPFHDEDSSNSASLAFSWLLAPCDTQGFFDDFFQDSVLVVHRKDPSYYGNFFSSQQMMTAIRENHLDYGRNINLAEYKDGVRITPNGTGRAYPLEVADAFRKGYSVQLTNPQAFSQSIWYLCDLLQELFHCFVGANTYLTPANSAGFAPHWDEIDAFLLQVEGRKYWKVYAPEDVNDELPLESSGNLTREEMKGRKCEFEGWLESGDLLYIPRGFIHQATTCPDTHSLHVTVSVGRQWTFSNVLAKVMPSAIEALTKDRVKLRRQLPPGLLDMAGVANVDYPLAEVAAEKFESVMDRNMSVLRRFLTNLSESGVDQMAREFMRIALPPVLTEDEKLMSVWGGDGDLLKSKGAARLNATTEICFLRRHGQRLCFESEDRCFVVHRMANARSYEERPEFTFDIPVEFSDAFGALQSAYPEWISIASLPIQKKKDRVEFARLLFNHGLLMAKDP